MKENLLDEIAKALTQIETRKVLDLVKTAIDQGVPPVEIVLGGLSKGLEIVGQKYEAMEYFLTELIMAGEIMKKAMNILKPHLEKEPMESLGRCVIGTVKGDIHDLGKNLVILMLSREFEIHDLGVDVPNEAFVEKVKETKANLLGLSAMLLSTMPAIREVITLLEKESIRNSVKVIVGGRVLNEQIAREYGADGYAKDAIEAVKVAKQLVS
ncbi:MAG: cobalamin B12-binding domain-containing protein [Candidatus Bathyarchaeia archaeon]